MKKYSHPQKNRNTQEHKKLWVNERKIFSTTNEKKEKKEIGGCITP
jgi:hypothetical protein